jgi:predicted DNA-binding transcriptional regulator YafY
MKKDDSKIRLLAVERILQSGRKMSASQICAELMRKYDIKADKKTIYSDILAVNMFVPTEVYYGRNGGTVVVKYD